MDIPYFYILLHVLLVLICIICCFILLYAVLLLQSAIKYRHLPGPKRSSLLFGHTKELATWCRRGRYVGDLYSLWFQEHGKLICLYFFHKVILFTVDKDVVKALLSNYHQFPKPKSMYGRAFAVFGKRFMGVSLLTETVYRRWHRKRLIINPAFHRSFLRTLMSQFNNSSDLLLKSLEEKADGQTVIDMHNYFTETALDIITKAGFTLDCHQMTEARSFPEALATVMKGMLAQRGMGILQRQFMYNGLKQDVRDALDMLRSTGRRVVLERMEMIKNGESLPEDILTKILLMQGGGYAMSMDEILDDFITFFVAGWDTTANQLAFTLMELCRHKDVVERLRIEAEAVVDDWDNITYEDLHRLTYLDHVLKESLRLYPPAAMILRQANNDTVIGQYSIPRNTPVAVNIYNLHRCPEYYTDPLEFDPSRFGYGMQRQSYTYVPFSMGSRTCIGKVFSQIEAKVVLTKFLHHFDFKPDVSQKWEVTELATLRPKGGVLVYLKSRLI